MVDIFSDKQNELARWALKYALSKGSSDGSITVYTTIENSFEYWNNQVDVLRQSVRRGMLIQLYVNGRFSSYTTNRLEKKDLERLIVHGIKITRYLEKDEFRKLPAISRTYQGDGRGLDTYDETIKDISLDEKLALIKENAQEVCSLDDRLISVSVEYSDEATGEYKIVSNGFEGKKATTYFSLAVETSMKDIGDTRPSAYMYDSALFWKDLRKTGIGKIAYKKNVRKLGRTKILSGSYKMLVDNLTIGHLLSPLMIALYGSAIQQKSSFLIGKLQQKIVSDKITIIDNPHIRRAIGARWFDAEGVATKKREIIREGVLNTYYMDTYYAKKLAMSPTIQSPSVLICKHGNENFEQIFSSIERGIWVTDFNGGNSNPTTGDFSFGIEGFLIENGKIVKPLHEMNITGNLLTLWQNVKKIGNDPCMNTSYRIPTILFDNVFFNGK